MSELSSLAPFGVIHLDRPGKVRDELAAFADGADAIFIEASQDQVSVRRLVGICLRAPFLMVGLATLRLYFYSPLFALFNRDLFQTELLVAARVADERDIDLHPVDEGMISRLGTAGPLGSVLNWTAVAAAVTVQPTAVAVTVPFTLVGGFAPLYARRYDRYLSDGLAALALVGGVVLELLAVQSTLFVALALLATVVFAVRTVGPRNDVMLDRIESVSTEEGYDHAVHVSGKGHLGGLVRGARQREVAVPRAHVSKWLRGGVTHEPVDPGDVPEIGTGDGSTVRRTVHPDSERSVFGRRALAAVADAVLVIVLWFVLVVAVGLTVEVVTGSERAWKSSFGLILLGTGLVSAPAYHTPLEYRFGTTVGKRLLGLGVAAADGQPLSLRGALVRNLLRPVDGVGLYLLGGLVAVFTDRRQRLGDLAAGTVVGRRRVESGEESEATAERGRRAAPRSARPETGGRSPGN